MLGLLLTAHFRAIHVADNQLNSPRARYVLEYLALEQKTSCFPNARPFLPTAHFRAIYVADNQLHSPRARYMLECKHRMAEDQDRFMDRFMDGTVGTVGVAGSSRSQIGGVRAENGCKAGHVDAARQHDVIVVGEVQQRAVSVGDDARLGAGDGDVYEGRCLGDVDLMAAAKNKTGGGAVPVAASAAHDGGAGADNEGRCEIVVCVWVSGGEGGVG
eukprot:366107-Chlamydomonas_euryale.AAC.4